MNQRMENNQPQAIFVEGKDHVIHVILVLILLKFIIL